MMIQASFLIPVASITNFGLLVLILPAMYAVLAKKTSLASTQRDLMVARGSILFLIIGSLGIAFSTVPSLLIICTYTPSYFIATFSLELRMISR